METYLTMPKVNNTSRTQIQKHSTRYGIYALLLFLSFGLLSSMASADTSSATNTLSDSETYPKKINFRNIMQNQDIALGEVEAITEDHEGFMWLGGRNALLRYDGYEFLMIPVANNPQDPTKTSPVNQVLELFEDSHHNLWAATRSGLYRYDRNRELLLPVQNSEGKLLLRETIYALAESPNAELLVGTGNGMSILNIKTLEEHRIEHQPDNPNSFPANLVSDLMTDPQGFVWAGTEEGIVRINWANKQHTLFLPDPTNIKSASNRIRAVAMDHSGNIWGGSDHGLYRLNPATGAIKHYQHNPADPFSLADNLSWQVYVDKRGWVWIGSDSGGVSLYDHENDRFLRYSRQDDRPGYLFSNTVRRIYEDKMGDLWVGTYPSGVNVYDRSSTAITLYKREIDLTKGLLDNNVEALEEDKDGNLWIGAGGVTRYNPQNETFTHYSKTDGSDSRVESTSVLNGVVDSDGEIRFGSWANGIQLYNAEKDRFEKVPTDPTSVKRGEKTGTKLNDLMVWGIYEDKQNTLWIATHFNGLTKFDKKTGIYTFYPHDTSNPSTISSALAWTTFEDSHGRFWVGTADGLNLMDRDQGTFKRYLPDLKKPRSLANNSVLSIWEDKKGRLWFGTDAGLHLYHSETDDFTVYAQKDGFADQGIRVITEDQAGNLWLGTNNGIVMFNPDTKLVRNYTRYNGELIGGVATGAGLTMRGGEVAFGTRSGLYIINPNKLLMNEKAPSVVFTDFRIFTQKVAINAPDKILTKSINQTEHITLDYTKSMLSFSFAALNYRDPEKNQYAYKLEGFDDDWRQVGNQRSALYTNLPAGSYQFTIKASNNDGVWGKEGRSIALVILPPPWKTWWAYTLYILIGIALLVYFTYTQHKQVLDERKTNRQLELKVAERTAELQHKNVELEQAYVQLEAISLSDPLTGLNNRRYLQKLIPMDIAKVQREYDHKFSNRPQKKPSLDLTFFILDVDFFKSVNDIYGHTAGDQLLIQLSELLTKICRESDCVVRWGGEEFLIVSRFTQRDEAPLTAERIRKSMEEHNFELPDGSVLKKTCSIGFACYPFLPDQPLALSWEHVIDIADRALYAAKKSGRNLSVGLAANANTNADDLHQRISSNLAGMIANNELTVITAENKALTWD
jgi:diguanylate cyclase (GGDEF)-like protein